MKGWVLFRVLGALLLVLGVVLALAACRVWDNPADPDGVNYQGYHTVKSADEVEAHTPQDGAEIVFLVFSVNKVLNAESHRLQIGSDLDFSETSLVYDKDDFPDRILNAEASLIVGNPLLLAGGGEEGWSMGQVDRDMGIYVRRRYVNHESRRRCIYHGYHTDFKLERGTERGEVRATDSREPGGVGKLPDPERNGYIVYSFIGAYK